MGRYIGAGIATQIDIYRRDGMDERIDFLLKRIDKVFNLKYYEIKRFKDNSRITVLLKPELFNKESKDLLVELADIPDIRWFISTRIKQDIKDYVESREEKKLFIDDLNNNYDFKLKRKGAKDPNFNNEVIYKYSLIYKDEEVFRDGLFSYENHLYWTDICNDSMFDDDEDFYGYQLGISVIDLYVDIDKTQSEDISAAVRFLNYFLRKGLKSNLKSTLVFGLFD